MFFDSDIDPLNDVEMLNRCVCGGVSRPSLRFEKDKLSINSFRGFIEKFSLFSTEVEPKVFPKIIEC